MIFWNTVSFAVTDGKLTLGITISLLRFDFQILNSLQGCPLYGLSRVLRR